MQHKKEELFGEIEGFINYYSERNGTCPTVRDIANAVGIANSTVCKYLADMEDRGIVVYDEHRRVMTRQMQSDLDNSTRTSIRILGSVACGGPKDAEEQIEDTVKLPKSIFGDGPLFILHADGESMIEAGIDDGDLVVIRQQKTAQPGQIVVAMVNGETTLKGYFPEPEKRRIRLQPANCTMKPMYFPSIEIQGIAVHVIKPVGRMCLEKEN